MFVFFFIFFSREEIYLVFVDKGVVLAPLKLPFLTTSLLVDCHYLVLSYFREFVSFSVLIVHWTVGVRWTFPLYYISSNIFFDQIPTIFPLYHIFRAKIRLVPSPTFFRLSPFACKLFCTFFGKVHWLGIFLSCSFIIHTSYFIRYSSISYVSVSFEI